MRFFLLALLGALMSTVIALMGYSVFRVLPWKTISHEPVLVWIPRGTPPKRVARILVANGIIDSEHLFRLYTRLSKTDRLLRPGEYAFYAPTPLKAVVDDLVAERVHTWKVTIPEGSSIQDIRRIFDQTRLEDKTGLYASMTDARLAREFGIEGATFEGFLFPETYTLTRGTPGKTVVETMARQFFKSYDPEDLSRAKQRGLSLFEWVTLASVIEKETGKREEQPLISSVFHNRLKKKMRLQSDPTVIYGIPNFNGNITKKDLQTDHPYNTYTRGGLPVGPICNPGLSALRAAAAPVESPYYYFVAKGQSGEHHFTQTYDEHRKAVAKHQLGQ